MLMLREFKEIAGGIRFASGVRRAPAGRAS